MGTNGTEEVPLYDCPIITDWQNKLMNNFSYMVEGKVIEILGLR